MVIPRAPCRDRGVPGHDSVLQLRGREPDRSAAGFLRDRGRWTEAVAYEIKQSARHPPALRGVDESWMGAPINDWSTADIRQIEVLRINVLGGSQTEPLRHLGEAQSCHVIASRRQFTGSWWVTDDTDAREGAMIRTCGWASAW